MDLLERGRMFVAVAGAGSFAAAARRAGVSSGQASKLVAGLEEELGVHLLNRTTRALSLTDAGRDYLGRIERLLAELDALHASLRDRSRTPAGRVRLTVPMSFGRLRLLPLLLEFRRRFPDIHLDVDLSDRIRSLVAEGFDAAVRIGHPVDSSLVARRVCDVGIVVAAAPDYLERHGIPGTPDALAGHACIVDTNFQDAGHWRFRARETGERIAVAVTGTLSLSDGEACATAAEAGLGIVRVPDFTVHRALAASRLRRILADWEEPPFGIYVVYPPARSLPRSLRVLIDFLAAELRSERPRDP
ncbi:MAG: LysR family transcriptional regulator [Gluconacetobacter diazotrophicus]|nr:LysR family transcriptional regulator [Gluconacetobacter diazotrophicus]